MLADKEQFIELWQLIQLVLVTSHGQASVERSFSVNDDIMHTNMKEQTLCAMKTVYDVLKSLDIKVHEFIVSDKMLQYCGYVGLYYIIGLLVSYYTRNISKYYFYVNSKYVICIVISCSQARSRYALHIEEVKAGNAKEQNKRKVADAEEEYLQAKKEVEDPWRWSKQLPIRGWQEGKKCIKEAWF